MTDKSLGEVRVRTDFNVGGNDKVAEIKNKTAELINLVFELSKDGEQAEKPILISLATTAYEEAAMWAVKAATA